MSKASTSETWPTIPLPDIQGQIFDLTGFGAVSGGGQLNSVAFSSAVARCHEAGGGTVRVPPGRWLTGPIHLKSRVRLELEAGAEIEFTPDFNAYLPVVFTRWEGVECYNYSPLVYANGAEDIAITGAGRLIGNGAAWWPWKQTSRAVVGEVYNMEAQGIDLSQRVFGMENMYRPAFIQPINCHRVLIEGVSVENSPMWTIHPVYCTDVTIRQVNVLGEGPNTDGLNPDSCERVWIEGCRFSTGDDCIAVNAGMNEDGWRVGKPCRDIYIQDCLCLQGHGGIVLGSAMSGGIERVRARNCQFDGTDRGIRLKAKRGRGGFVRDTLFEDIRMTNIKREAVVIDMFYTCGPVSVTDTPPDFSDITIQRVTGNSLGQAVYIAGLPEQRLRCLTLKSVDLAGQQGLSCRDVDGLMLDHVRIQAATKPGMHFTRTSNLTVTEVETDSPVEED